MGDAIGLIPDDEKIYIDAPYFSLYRWQAFCGALYYAIKSDITPISDNAILSSIACESVNNFSDFNLNYTPADMSKLLGFKALSSLLPNFGKLKSEQILEVRDELRDELLAFRHEMLQLSMQESIDEQAIDNCIEFKIKPRIEDLKLKVSSSKKALFRKLTTELLTTGTGATFLTQFVNLPIYAKICMGIGLVGKLALDCVGYRNNKNEIMASSSNKGLALIIDMENKY